MNTIGMSTPGATSLGGNLSQQVSVETEEQRRKRLLAQQQARLLPNTALGGSLYSMSVGSGGVGGFV
jgi:hypothetical protein